MARQKMSMDKRAAQFLPFKAVKGLDEALLAKEKIVVEKIQLSEESLGELDIKMHEVKKGMMVSAIYYCKGEYLRTTGLVARIDETSRILRLSAPGSPSMIFWISYCRKNKLYIAFAYGFYLITFFYAVASAAFLFSSSLARLSTCMTE